MGLPCFQIWVRGTSLEPESQMLFSRLFTFWQRKNPGEEKELIQIYTQCRDAAESRLSSVVTYAYLHIMTEYSQRKATAKRHRDLNR